MSLSEKIAEKGDLAKGNAYFLRGDYEKALEAYLTALKNSPDFFVHYENIGWCYERLDDRFNAKKYYKKALELNPNAIRAKFFVSGTFTIENGTIKNKPIFFPQIHAASAAIDKQALKDEYFEKKLHLQQDDFALIRIIGNDLYPRHKIGQSRENVAFILENERPFERCRKIWIVNRIFNQEELSNILALLEKHKQEYHVIPFVEDEYKSIGLDYSCLPSPDFLHSDEFEKLSSGMKQRALVSLLRLKNNYVMNNNGARNYALNLGKSIAKWVLPWDGNCFLNKASWDAIVKGVLDEPYLKHFVVPMARITSNDLMLNDTFIPEATEEPQIIIRNDSREKFNADFSYGRRPKVELFWRLGIPGPWDNYKDDRWDIPRLPPSPEAHQFGITGWTARLFSGMAEQESQDNKGSANRNSARQVAIIAAIQHVDRSFKLNDLCDPQLNLIIEQTISPARKIKDATKIIKSGNDVSSIHFISNRNDGLGERLKAMLNAIVMAKIFKSDFHVLWPDEVSAGKEYHAIDSKEYLFSKDYVAQHFIDNEFLAKQKVYPLSDRLNIQDLFVEGEHRYYLCHQNEKFQFLKNFGEIEDGIYKDAFYSIKFSESVSQAITAAKMVNIGSKAAAVHIRGGDIIYGRYRLSERYQSKAVCFPVAVALIEKLRKQGFTPVVFFQDEAIETELKSGRFGKLVLARDYSSRFGVTEQAMFEITLMSRCQTIIAGTSGFAEVAARISGVKVQKTSNYLEKSESVNAIKNWISQDKIIDNFQYSFALLNYVLLGENLLTPDDIDEALLKAELSDPPNGLYPAKRMLNMWKAGRLDAANKIIASNIEKYQESSWGALPFVQALSASTSKGLAMLKYFDGLPHFKYTEFQELGIVHSYIKVLTKNIHATDESIPFLHQVTSGSSNLSKYAKSIINLIR